jgi:hypothetical protein
MVPVMPSKAAKDANRTCRMALKPEPCSCRTMQLYVSAARPRTHNAGHSRLSDSIIRDSHYLMLVLCGRPGRRPS